MGDITLEKIDAVRERTGVSYTEAKEALEASNGDVVDALVYVEKKKSENKGEVYTSAEEFLNWLKKTIKKGNVSRIKIKKDDKVLLDVPVNAGVAAGVIALFSPTLLVILGAGAVAAVLTKLTVEITKSDGTVEVVNKVIKNTASTVKEKVSNIASDVKEKVDNIKNNGEGTKDDNVYQYKVNFDDDDNKEEK